MFLSENLGMNQDKHLTIGGHDVVALAEKYQTPLYLMDEEQIRQNCRAYKNALDVCYGGNGLILYASKAFLCKAVCKLMQEEGMGLDVVSGGELYTALSAGFPADKIYMHGNNKTYDELLYAIENNVGRIVVDNIHELLMISEIAKNADKQVKVSFRVKPGIEAHTHEFIRTGQIDSKFGFALETGEAQEAIEKAASYENIVITGVHCHIGSQIFDMQPFVEAAERMIGFMANLKDTLGILIQELNLGGGFGIKYTEDDAPIPYGSYIEAVSMKVKELCRARDFALPFIVMEPGRSIVAAAGITVYTVGAVKEIPGIRKYITVDGGMVDNPRYIMYGAKYAAVLANRADAPAKETVTIAGKCCESGDILVKDIEMPVASPGDKIAVLATGAYNYSMSSNYNRIPRPPVVMVNQTGDRLIVKRETYEDLLRNDL